MRIVFMGTPDFAVASLAALMKSNHQVVGVITAPDKPAGRGKKITASAVKQFALAHKLPILQPHRLKDPDFLSELKAWKADLQVVVAFRMLPEVVWNMPPKGTVNVHASLLPNYRGAAPINWAIINGEKQTGVTTFLLQHEIDTGAVLLQDQAAISPNMNAGQLHDVLMERGAHLLIDTLNKLEKGTITPTPQSELIHTEQELKEAPKIFKEDCRINWTANWETVYNHIRGLSPYPGAWSMAIFKNGQELPIKIYETTPLPEHHLAPGHVLIEGHQLIIGCKTGSLKLNVVQLAGKKRMPAEDLTRGLHSNPLGKLTPQ